MKYFVLLPLFLSVAPLRLASAKPKQGKVRIYVTVRENSVSDGVKQRGVELKESAQDLKTRLNKREWVEPTEEIEKADIRLTVIGRRRDPERGFVLKYELDAGAYKTQDEFAYEGEAIATGGVRSLESGTQFGDKTSGRAMLGWGQLARKLGDSLEEFCEANYDRIVSQR